MHGYRQSGAIVGIGMDVEKVRQVVRPLAWRFRSVPAEQRRVVPCTLQHFLTLRGDPVFGAARPDVIVEDVHVIDVRVGIGKGRNIDPHAVHPVGARRTVEEPECAAPARIVVRRPRRAVAADARGEHLGAVADPVVVGIQCRPFAAEIHDPARIIGAGHTLDPDAACRLVAHRVAGPDNPFNFGRKTVAVDIQSIRPLPGAAGGHVPPVMEQAGIHRVRPPLGIDIVVDTDKNCPVHRPDPGRDINTAQEHCGIAVCEIVAVEEFAAVGIAVVRRGRHEQHLGIVVLAVSWRASRHGIGILPDEKRIPCPDLKVVDAPAAESRIVEPRNLDAADTDGDVGQAVGATGRRGNKYAIHGARLGRENRHRIKLLARGIVSVVIDRDDRTAGAAGGAALQDQQYSVRRTAPFTRFQAFGTDRDRLAARDIDDVEMEKP